MRDPVIDNLRGICMLGVIAIHAGSLAAEAGNFWLFIFLEVLSRYSVPSFFFISGYGLFCGHKEGESYRSFIQKRLCGVGVPYLSWSLLYMAYFTFLYPAQYAGSWQPPRLAFILFFGLGCYHLYFMVILLWFYFSFPLWRALVTRISRHGVRRGLALLFIFQVAFNYWTVHPGVTAASLPALLQNHFIYRLNYLPLHYLLIFSCGGLAALHSQAFYLWLRRRFTLVALVFAASVACLVASCLYTYHVTGYTLPELANTYHQLSLQGLLYTLGSLAFWCAVLAMLREGGGAFAGVSLLARHSLLMYLVHPLVLSLLDSFYASHGIVMTVKKVIFSYLLLVGASLLLSVGLRRILRRSRTAAFLLMGTRRA